MKISVSWWESKRQIVMCICQPASFWSTSLPQRPRQIMQTMNIYSKSLYRRKLCSNLHETNLCVKFAADFFYLKISGNDWVYSRGCLTVVRGTILSHSIRHLFFRKWKLLDYSLLKNHVPAIEAATCQLHIYEEKKQNIATILIPIFICPSEKNRFWLLIRPFELKSSCLWLQE